MSSSADAFDRGMEVRRGGEFFDVEATESGQLVLECGEFGAAAMWLVSSSSVMSLRSAESSMVPRRRTLKWSPTM